jgi:hypothetical protein
MNMASLSLKISYCVSLMVIHACNPSTSETETVQVWGQPELHSETLFQNIYIYGWAPVAHAYNPSYSRGRNQEDRDLKPKQIVWGTLSRKYPSQNGLVQWLKVKALSSSPVPHTHTHTNGWAPVVHTCNPSYLGGRDQEDWSSKPAQANSSWDFI